MSWKARCVAHTPVEIEVGGVLGLRLALDDEGSKDLHSGLFRVLLGNAGTLGSGCSSPVRETGEGERERERVKTWALATHHAIPAWF